MPEWIHNRAEHLLAKNPSMKKSTAFAVATSQAHALGKSPKGYGTQEGRIEAKAKYPTPKDDTKTANPRKLDSPKLSEMTKYTTEKNAMFRAMFDELHKLGQINDEQLEHALSRYETLERNKPTLKQVARYGALGAVTAPAIAALGDAVAGKPILGGGNPIRSIASKAVMGTLTSGAIPLVRSHLDRQSEKSHLRKLIREKLKEGAGAPTRGGFMMSSEVPAFTVPSLKSPIIKKTAATATTPAGILAQAKRVGLPKVSAPPGPSIADTVNTSGSRLPGANKTTIGKRPYKPAETLGGMVF